MLARARPSGRSAGPTAGPGWAWPGKRRSNARSAVDAGRLAPENHGPAMRRLAIDPHTCLLHRNWLGACPGAAALAVRQGSAACVRGAESSRAGCGTAPASPPLCRRDRRRASSRRDEERQGAPGAAPIEPGCPERDRSVAADAGGGSAEQERPRASRRSVVPLLHRGDLPPGAASCPVPSPDQPQARPPPCR
jgi:hypothetical protein